MVILGPTLNCDSDTALLFGPSLCLLGPASSWLSGDLAWVYLSYHSLEIRAISPTSVGISSPGAQQVTIGEVITADAIQTREIAADTAEVLQWRMQ